MKNKLFGYIIGNFELSAEARRIVWDNISWCVDQAMHREDTINTMMKLFGDSIGMKRSEIEKFFSPD